MKRVAWTLAALLLATGCATTTPPESPAAAIDRITQTPPYDKAIWGIHAEDQSGRVLYSRNSQTLLAPASNRKLFAAFTIASCLGPLRQLSTEVWLDGADIVVRGDGDPSFGSLRYERDRDVLFAPVIAALRARGITEVRDVVADVSAFDRVTIPGGWKVGNLPYDYAAPVDALSFAENEIADMSVPNGALLAATELRDALLFAGFRINGLPRVVTEPRVYGEKAAALDSPYVMQLLMTVLKNSQNMYTETLLKRSVTPGSYDAALVMEERLLAEIGIPNDETRFVDGSGLAPDNMVTPRAVVRLLRWMNDPYRRDFWWELLAAAGGEGTLRRRLVPYADRIRGKTGTILGVNALSGIIRDPRGDRYFSVILNHHTGDGDEAAKLIDAIVEELAR